MLDALKDKNNYFWSNLRDIQVQTVKHEHMDSIFMDMSIKTLLRKALPNTVKKSWWKNRLSCSII